MKSYSMKRPATLGDFITAIYDECGERKGKGIVLLAFKAHLVEFLGKYRAVTS